MRSSLGTRRTGLPLTTLRPPLGVDVRLPVRFVYGKAVPGVADAGDPFDVSAYEWEVTAKRNLADAAPLWTLDEDGGITLIVGTMTNGQGHHTAYAQLLNEKLGVEPDKVRMIQGDSDVVKHGGGTAGRIGRNLLEAVEAVLRKTAGGWSAHARRQRHSLLRADDAQCERTGVTYAAVRQPHDDRVDREQTFGPRAQHDVTAHECGAAARQRELCLVGFT